MQADIVKLIYLAVSLRDSVIIICLGVPFHATK